MSQTTPFYLICNVGTYAHSPVPFTYPYQLFLAQIWKESEVYRRSINQIRNMHNKKSSIDFIIDNGAHEGIVMSPSEYYRICIDSEPDCIVLPDLIGKHSESSRQRSMVFAEQVVKDLPNVRLMYVPQGQNKDQILDEFRWAIRNLDPGRFTIGFGQSYLTFERAGHRDEMARMELMDLVLQDANAHRARFHVLGGRWNPMDFEAKYWRKFTFLGLDSIKPVTCALAGTVYPVKPQGAPVDRFSDAHPEPESLRQNIIRFCDMYGLSIDGLFEQYRPMCPHCKKRMLSRASHWACKTCSMTVSNDGITHNWNV